MGANADSCSAVSGGAEAEVDETVCVDGRRGWTAWLERDETACTPGGGGAAVPSSEAGAGLVGEGLEGLRAGPR